MRYSSDCIISLHGTLFSHQMDRILDMANTWLCYSWTLFLSSVLFIRLSRSDVDYTGFERLCNHPERPSHGSVEVWGNGWLVTFTCDPGYAAIGEVLGACNLRTGRWTINPPFCVARSCPRTPMRYLKNGRAHFLHGGAVVRFSCSPGHFLAGNTELHCTGTRWSGERPECKAVEDPEEAGNNLAKRNRGRTDAGKSRHKWVQHKNNLTSIMESDDTCMSRSYRVKVPKIPHSSSKIIYLKNLGKRYEWIPVVTYTCLPGFRLENEENKHLYCKTYRYDAAIFPSCLPEVNPCDVDHGNATCHQICKPVDVQYKCHCRRGFSLADDGIACNDIDECRTNRGICGQNSCQNTIGSYICMCARPGYQKINNRCLDVDECSRLGKVTCPGPCINLPGTYACNCSIPGYRSTSNLQFCEDVDECAESNGGCEHLCVNTRGSYNCRCERTGFKLDTDGKSCVDIDECKRYKSICNLGGFCFNTVGSYLCECGFGFTVHPDKAHCEDQDECKSKVNSCRQLCVNTPGSFHCACRPGFRLQQDNKTCADIVECEEGNGGCEGRCVNTIGSFRCICLKRGYIIGKDKMSCKRCPVNTYFRGRRRTGRCERCPANSHTNGPAKKFKKSCRCDPGYRGIPALDIPCRDINECDVNNFGCAFECENTPGSAHCACPEGYTVMADGKGCDDLDECAEDNWGCDDHCVNEDGSAHCECLQPGFVLGADGKSCDDVNECLTDNFNCSDICVNTIGTALCNCSQGYYVGQDGKTCQDVDECRLDNGGCEDACLNVPGSYHCECHKAGYRLNTDRRTCEDINECYEQTGLCGDTCRNTKGSYLCLCRDPGFLLNADGKTCDDIDECSTNDTNVCEDICINTHGSYKCICRPGYVVEGQGACRECPENAYSSGNDTLCQTCPANSHTPATGHKARGECTCNSGYTGDLSGNKECQDIDECLESLLKCSHICVNVVGSAYCSCPQGYKLQADKLTCLDQDECSYKNGQCEHICVNTPGAYWCKCRKGYEPNPYQSYRCQDLNECQERNGGCSHICVNTLASYYCTCPRSFFMTRDKKTCKERFCYILPVPSFGDMRPESCSNPPGPGVTVDTTCFFTCPEAFSIQGSSRRTCQNNGQWDGTSTRCIAKECPMLKKQKYGTIFPKRCTRWNSEVDDKCFYGCKPGYIRVGSAFTTCTSKERWSHPPPICVKEAKCAAIIGPKFGQSGCVRKPDGRKVCSPTCPVGKMFYSPLNTTYVCVHKTWKPSGSIPDCVGFRKQDVEEGCGDGAEFRTNSSLCVQCPSGMYRKIVPNASRPHRCLLCPLGSYQPHVGRSSCLRCPDGWNTSPPEGATSVERCDVNTEEFSGDVEDLGTGSGEESNNISQVESSDNDSKKT